jgi:soluble lytic murein transglycosylase-like protein
MQNKIVAVLLLFLSIAAAIEFAENRGSPPIEEAAPAPSQHTEALSSSAKDQLSKAVILSKAESDSAVGKEAFSESAYVQSWLVEMSKRLATHIPDAGHREDFLRTLHYESARAGLDPEMVLGLIEVGSGFRKYAVSSSTAQGYMQVLPVWTTLIGTPDHNLFHLRTNLRYGVAILRHYIDIEKGDLFHALAKYGSPLGQSDLPNKVYASWRNHWTYGLTPKNQVTASQQGILSREEIVESDQAAPKTALSPSEAQVHLQSSPSDGSNIDRAKTTSLPKLTAREIYAEASKSVYMLVALGDESLSQGSGIAIFANLVLTNQHVIKNMQDIYAKKGEKLVPLKRIFASESKDIAVLRTEAPLPSIRQIRRFDTLDIGEKVFSISSPRGLENTFSEGIISGLREHEGVRYIQTTTPITKGSSGGALLDEYGRLIGITTLGSGIGNLNFAVAIDEVEGIK